MSVTHDRFAPGPGTGSGAGLVGGRLLPGLAPARQLALAIAGAEQTARLFGQYGTKTLEHAVRDARLWLAQALLACDGAAILAADRRGLFAATGLIRATIRDLPRDRAEQHYASVAGTICRAGWNDARAVAGFFLAVMFLQGFEGYDPAVALDRVPADIRRGVVRHLVERPLFFEAEDEPERYFDFIRALLRHLNDHAESRPGDPLWAEITAHAAAHLDLLQAFPTRRNMRPLAVERARLAERHLAAQGLALDWRPGARRPGRPRIGLLARAIGPRVESFINAAAFAHIDRSRHHAILYVLDDVEQGRDYHRVFRDRIEGVRDLQGLDVAEAVAALRADDLDMLIATNVNAATLERMNSVYAHRLARRQVLLSAISPTTTGHASFDAVITAPGTEPDDAQAHYSERVAWMDGHFNCFAFDGAGLPRRDQVPAAADTRAAFGLPLDRPVLLSGASYYKLCPHLTRTWMAVLGRDDRSVLALYPFNPHWSDRFANAALAQRLRREAAAAGIDSARVHLLPPLSRDQCFALAAAADVYLDSFPYSGAGSLVEPLAMATPLVTLAGQSQRACQGAAMVRAVGLDGCVATDADHYVDIAAALVADPARRRQISEHLRGHALTSPVFDSADYAARFWACVDRLLDGGAP